MNIAELLLSSHNVQQSKGSIACPAYQFDRLGVLNSVNARARQLHELGVQSDDFVVLLCGQGSQFWIDLLAIWTLGARAVPIEPDLDADHAKNVVRVTGAKWLAAADAPECLAELTPLPDQPGAAEAIRSSPQLPFGRVRSSDEVACVMFTSGTTGLPKGVPLTHQQLGLNLLAALSRIQLQSDDRMMVATPFRFMSAICHFMAAMVSGAAFFGDERKLGPKDLIAQVAGQEITAFGGSPFHLRFIGMAGADRLPHLRWVMSSGDHLPLSTITDLQSNFSDLAVHVFYGMVEVGGRMCSLPPEHVATKAGSVGVPLPGLAVDILDESGSAVAAGEIGELHVKGAYSFRGYLNNQAATNDVISDRGFRTGDMGYQDEDGFLFLAGRSDSVFKRSGQKVSAQVVTDQLIELGLYDDVWVGSRTDEVQGRVPVVYFVCEESEPPVESDVLRALRESIPTNHLPGAFVRLRSIPRTGSGKVQRQKLEEMKWE